MATILMALLAGIIIGPLARLVLPGRQNISLTMTVLLGAVGALAGSWIYRAISGNTDTSGIDWIALGIGVVVAALAIVGYGSITGREESGQSGGHPTS
ncbi:MAG TPA: GlsB/YeaQ/YmgE family stress response membrane protein [Dermatophilaceae bacterium]